MLSISLNLENKLIIEKLNLNEIDEAVKISSEIHQQSLWNKYEFDSEFARKYITFLMNHQDRGFIFACKEDGHIVGGMVGVINQFPFCKDKFADLFVLFLKKEYRGRKHAIGMMKTYINEAKKYNVKEIRCGVNTPGNFEKVERLFAWCGFKKTGSSWAM